MGKPKRSIVLTTEAYISASGWVISYCIICDFFVLVERVSRSIIYLPSYVRTQKANMHPKRQATCFIPNFAEASSGLSKIGDEA